MEYSISACFSLHHVRLCNCLIERLYCGCDENRRLRLAAGQATNAGFHTEQSIVTCTKMRTALFCQGRIDLSEVLQESRDLRL